MKRGYQISVMVCALSMYIAVSPVSALRVSLYKATIDAAEEIILGNTDTVSFKVAITTPQGLPFSSDRDGPVELWATYGQFIKPDGTISDSPMSVQVENGEFQAAVSLKGFDIVPHPLTIRVTKGPYEDHELLGEAKVNVLYPASVAVSDASSLSAAADGAAHPVANVIFKDQFGQPLKGLQVRVLGYSEDGEILGNTDDRGEARIRLPARTQAGYYTYQVQGGSISSPIIWVLCTKGQIPTMPLRNGVSRAKAQLIWDSTSRTASAESPLFQVRVREGESHALLNGNRIPLGTAARLKDGRIEVPVLFLRQVIGLKV